jgi:hypothetical protein
MLKTGVGPLSEVRPPAGGRPEPGQDSGWWTAWRTVAVYCSACRHVCQDRPAVMRYRKAQDLNGTQARLYPDWPARGWLAWWECTHCDNTNVTEAVDDRQVAEWNRRLGPWYRSDA